MNIKKSTTHMLSFLLCSLMLTSCASTVPEADYLAAQESINDLEKQIDTLKTELSETSSQLSKTQSELSEVNSKLTEDENLVSNLTQANIELSDQIDELENTKSTLQEQVASLTFDNRQLNNELKTYQCKDTLVDMQYDSIINASEILSGWMARQDWVERVQGTYRDSIWNNADTKIHGIRYISSDDHEPYVDYFLIYFNEFGWTEGVFWLSGQCWLTKE